MRKKVNKKSGNFLHDHFMKSVSELKEIKIYFWFSFLLFFAITLFGAMFPVFFVDRIYDIIETLSLKTRDMGVFELIKFIMSNNITSAFMGVITGIFLGVFPVVVIIVNSYILGFVINKSVMTEGIFIIWRLFPHGIFEIPAILISVSLGIRLGYLLMNNCIHAYNKNKNLSSASVAILMFLSIIFLPISFFIYLILTFTNKNLKNNFLSNVWMSIRIFILIVVPLLVIAGIVEGFLIYLVK